MSDREPTFNEDVDELTLLALEVDRLTAQYLAAFEADRMAARNLTAAKNRLNDAQKKFDAHVNSMRGSAPVGTDWMERQRP